MRLVLLLLLLSLALSAFAQSSDPDKDQRMKWWREARLGLFIHWGLYSIPAGKWGDRTDHAEWIRDTAHIPVKEYEKFRDQFNPVDFDANKWVKMAKDAGMKYIVITTKHHDGFNLFHSDYTDWDVAHTPFKRDIMKELSEACAKEGIKMCWYHSIMDWHHPDYLPRRPWEVKDRPVDGADFKKYNEYLRNEVTELLTHYGPIGLMWFDGEWENTWNDSYGRPLYELCRKLQPNVIVNNRVSNNRSGSTEAAAPITDQVGDYTTPEQYIPPTGLPGVDWESCMTMNGNWGFNAADHNWKSSKVLIHNIVDIASKGGNYLLNVGPMSNGEFPPEAVARLKDIGDWMQVNGDSIYGTQASVFDTLPWGRSTTKKEGSNTTLYLHIFDWPADGKLVVPAIGNQPESAVLLAGNQNLTASRNGSSIEIQLPATAPSDICSTIALKIKGEPVVYRTPKIGATSDIIVGPQQISIDAGSPGMEVRYTLDGSDPTLNSSVYTQPLTISDTTTIKAATFANGSIVSAIASATLTKVIPEAAVSQESLVEGLHCDEYRGDWDIVPEFTLFKPSKSFNATELSVPTHNGSSTERVGRVYTGYISIPADEVYSFALTSDDGSKLWIGNTLVVDNDGLHGTVTKTGHAALAQGWHPIRIEWFNKSGDASLGLAWGKAGKALKAVASRDFGRPK